MSARYDVRVRTLLGPPIRAYLAPGGRCVAVEEGSVHRVLLTGDWDLVRLYDHLVARGVDVVGIRRLS